MDERYHMSTLCMRHVAEEREVFLYGILKDKHVASSERGHSLENTHQVVKEDEDPIAADALRESDIPESHLVHCLLIIRLGFITRRGTVTITPRQINHSFCFHYLSL